MRQPVLKVEGIGISFGGLKAVQNVSLEVYPGEFVGLIGPNGAGKSTVLNLISGIYSTQTGKIFFNGQDITKMPPYHRAKLGIGRTFQTPRLLNRASIRDNLYIGTDLGDHISHWSSFWGTKRSDFQQALDTYMEIAGFSFDWKDDINALPFGKKKRLEIVRALLASPKLLMVDEPAAGLNMKELEYSVALLKHAAQMGVGVLLIEHQMDMIMNVCDRVVVLNFGEKIADDIPQKVKRNPAVIEAYLGRSDDA